MQRLRHPIRSIREPFGKAGLTVAILALVFAMVGGAWAAVGLNSKQKKEVTKIAKKYAGKPGAPGAAGANGTNGTAGAKGDTGAAGGQGIQGIQGIPGPNGKTVLNGPGLPTADVGTLGDFYIMTSTDEIFGPKAASGANGGWGTGTELEGPTGSPWTVGGVLPQGETLMGKWGTGGSAGQFFAIAPISFNIPLGPPPLEPSNVHFASNTSGEGKVTSGSSTVSEVEVFFIEPPYVDGDNISGTGIPSGTHITKVEVEKEEFPNVYYKLTLSANATASGTGVSLTATPPAACPGTVGAPQAEPGHLCVYVEQALGVVRDESPVGTVPMSINASSFGAEVSASTQGSPIIFVTHELVEMKGSWAVTAG